VNNAGKERQNIRDISTHTLGTQPQNCTALDPRRIQSSLLGYLMMLLQLQGVRQDDNEKVSGLISIYYPSFYLGKLNKTIELCHDRQQ
jgi:hypothetical protein